MNLQGFSFGFRPPPVYGVRRDVVRLQELVRTAREGSPLGIALLRLEADRLQIVSESAAHDFVRLDSEVRYRDLRTKLERRVRVVDPGNTQVDSNDVSVLSPIGAALIGLSQRAIFRWPDMDGRTRAIKVLELQHACCA